MSVGKWNAETIRAERRRRNWRQAELAKKLGSRQQTVSEWEIGLYAPKSAYQKLLTLVFDEHPVQEVSNG